MSLPRRATSTSIATLATLALAAGAASQQDFLPGNLLSIGNGSASHALVVEKDTEKLFLFEGSDSAAPRLVRTWNATTGQKAGDKSVEGDLRTPEGIYFFTSALEDAELPPEYGVRALVLDYPNLFDQRRRKTGNGIWLHATDEIVRPLTSMRTRGCVVVTNRDVLEISRLVALRDTPIVVEKTMPRLSESQWRAAREDLLATVGRWRTAWATSDLETLASFYADDFRGDGLDRTAWLRKKREVARDAGRIEVEVRHPLVLRRGDEAIVRFGQVYLSGPRNDFGDKTLWLEKRDGDWRIVSEQWQALAPPPDVVARFNRRPSVEVASLAGASMSDGAAPPVALPAATPAPVAVAAAVAPPPVVRVAEPAAAGADSARALALNGFLADLGRGEMAVNFRLERVAPSSRPATGAVALVVRVRTIDGKRRTLAWPPAGRVARGLPADPGAGDPFSVRRFKEVEARVAGIPHGADLEGVSVFVYDRSGALLLREDYGG